MLVWIVVIILTVSGAACLLGRTYKRDGTMIVSPGKLNKFCSRRSSLAGATTVISAIILALMLFIMLIQYTGGINLITKRNTAQMTLDSFRQRAESELGPSSLYERAGTIHHVFKINEEIAITRYWNQSIWVGIFIYDKAAALKYIE